MTDNTRKIRKIKIKEDRKMTDPLKHGDMTQLRSVMGSLSWIARQGRPAVQDYRYQSKAQLLKR